MEMTFEDSLKELEKIISELEDKEINLEDAVKKYNDALNLSKECYRKLDDAKLIIKEMNGNKEEDFNGEKN